MAQVERYPNVKKGVWMMCTYKYEDYNPNRSVEEHRSYECRFYGKKILVKPVLHA